MFVAPADLKRALARVAERDSDAARSAGQTLVALRGFCDDPEVEPLRLSRYDVGTYVWYTLPAKTIAPLHHLQAIPQELALAFDVLGEAAAPYAAICRAPVTRALIDACERDDPDWYRLFCAALAATGTQPPDTPALAWGGVMGLVEAGIHDATAMMLDDAIDEGRLDPQAAGFGRAQRRLVEAFLAGPSNDGPVTRRDAIHAERREWWVHHQGPLERELLLLPLYEQLAGATLEPIGRAEAQQLTEPYRWLLAQAAGPGGIVLTQTEALPRALVREAARRFGWWRHDIHGEPHRETDIALLCELRDQARQLGLVRKRGRRLVATRLGLRLLDAPSELLAVVAAGLMPSQPFTAAVAELVFALLLAEQAPARDQMLTTATALLAEGWLDQYGERPNLRVITWHGAQALRPAELAGVIEREERWPEPMLCRATDAGRHVLAWLLDERATAPRERP